MQENAEESRRAEPLDERGNERNDRRSILSLEPSSTTAPKKSSNCDDPVKASTDEKQLPPEQPERLRRFQTLKPSPADGNIGPRAARRASVARRAHKSATLRRLSRLRIPKDITGPSLRARLDKLIRSKTQPAVKSTDFEEHHICLVKRSESANHCDVDRKRWKKAKERLITRQDNFPFSTKLVSRNRRGGLMWNQGGGIYSRAQKIDCLLFLPNTSFIYWWNWLVITLLLYTAYVMPYKLSFVDSPGMNWFCVDLTIDCLFMCDVIINLNTSFYSAENVLITQRSTIFWEYLKGWMIFDIIASVPIDAIEVAIFGTDFEFKMKTLRLARLPRLYRLIRITRFIKISKIFKKSALFEQLDEFFETNTGFGRLMMFIVTVLTCVHIMGCFWYYFAKLDDFNPDTWVVRFGFIDAGNGSLYLASIYWAFQTLLTVGYGDCGAFTTSKCCWAGLCSGAHRGNILDDLRCWCLLFHRG